MRFLSAAEKGMYLEGEEDMLAGIHPDLLHRYYGADHPHIQRRLGQTGAGHPADEADDFIANVEAHIEEDQQGNVRHKPIEVPITANPFGSSAIEDLFDQALMNAHSNSIIPDGHMVSENDWVDSSYPSHEEIMTGTRSGKKLLISLPPIIWERRAILWAQGLRVMEQFVIELNDE
jgi:hypothetical protein